MRKGTLLQRGICPRCGRERALRTDGQVHAHLCPHHRRCVDELGPQPACADCVRKRRLRT
jgi:hypothetical protein